MDATPKHFREQADHARKLAQKAEDGTTRANLLDVARQFERLAEKAEAEV